MPESAQGHKSGASENPPYVVSIDTNGVYFVEKMPITFDQLTDKLKAAAVKNPKLVLAINADENAPWGKVVKIRDAAAAAGIKSLVAFTKEPPKQ